MKNSQRGYSLFELLIVTAIISVLVGWFIIVKGILMGNHWFSESDVLRKIKLDESAATEVLDSTRNIYDDSVVLVAVGNKRVPYCLDTNIIFNYSVKKCPGN